MKYIAAMALSVGLAVAGGANATVNLVQNGGFENLTDNAYYNHEFGQAATGAFAIAHGFNFGDDVAGWSSASPTAYNLWFQPGTSTSVDAVGRYSPGVPGGQPGQYLWTLPAGDPNGGAFLALDGASTANGAVTQTINGLVKGAKYVLTFSWATAQLEDRSGATWDKLDYSLGSQGYTTAQAMNPSHGGTGWYTVTQTFTATGSSEVLSFLAHGVPGNLPPVVLLDGVSLSNVPEPATWAMMLVGFGAIGYGMRRRRVAVAAA